MEIQRVPELDFEELGLVSGMVILQKFKVPTFSKYDGASCPKLHLRSFVRKIQQKKTTTQGLRQMKLTTLRSSILLLMINTNSWRIVSIPWKSKGYPG